ncbi:MAG: carboxymuconolactone decarboxylase family protein [Gemmatimonadales bacterium]|nr:carboxymuconolactone decarboxylase family protein [Gemmatimonadales bacterium]MDZ4388500.1 carboxymuconolactone decarboxylase family protein [Gemmatimonadales bacterium]
MPETPPPKPLDDATRALVTLAAAIAQGDEPAVREEVAEAIIAKVPLAWVDELLLQSMLMVGWPRTLVAAGLWRQAVGAPATEAESGLDYAEHADWTARGEETCRLIYGDNYAKLRRNVSGIHPALDVWMITEGYGRTLSRPGLDLVRRELCVIAQTAVLDTPRQLHSHLRGALNAGASPALVEAVLTVVNPFLAYDHWKAVKELWDAVRDAWESVA